MGKNDSVPFFNGNTGVLNSGLHSCKADPLSLEPHTPAFLVLVIFYMLSLFA
jgi:hypothetical protein